MKAKKSPVRLICKPGVFEDVKICRWTCVAPVRAAQFRDRHDPTKFAVVHPSTKKHGYAWQVSYFDAQGPWGDSPRKSCTEAFHELHPSEWRLEEVVGVDELAGTSRKRRRRR